MPAYPTHTLFAHMALRALADVLPRHPLARVSLRHAALFRVAGIAGCDIQCMPYQVCAACSAPYRHDQKDARRCLACGKEALEDFRFEVSDGRRLTRRDVELDLYANTHLVLYRRHRGYGVAPDANAKGGPPEQPLPRQAVDHLAFTLIDADRVAGRAGQVEQYLAFTLGWFAHVVSDAVFKGLYPQAAKVRFFGQQYATTMLPAAEAVTMTDIAHDFGVTWPLWHRELLREQPDGGALRHLAMGNPPETYGPQWTPEHGRPDSAIGRVIDALRPINRTWFHRMYTTPDYTAATPVLDRRQVAERAGWRFGREDELDLGRLRRYAIGTGWYGSFLAGVGIYLHAVSDAARRAGYGGRYATAGGAGGATTAPATAPAGLGAGGAGGEAGGERDGGGGALPAWGLWREMVEAAAARAERLREDWGSRVDVRRAAAEALRRLRGRAIHVIEPNKPTDYQASLVRTLREKLGMRHDPAAGAVASDTWRVVIGPPAYNPAAEGTGEGLPLLCREDALRLKYEDGAAAVVTCDAAGRVLLLAGLSDFGDHLLGRWVAGLA